MASVLFWTRRLYSNFRTIKTLTSNAPQLQKISILSRSFMQNLFCSPSSSLLKIGTMFLAGTKKKKSRTEASKAAIKMFPRDLTHKIVSLRPSPRTLGAQRPPSQRRAKSKQCTPDPLLLRQQSHWHSAPLSNSAYLTQPFVSGCRNH